MATVPTGYVFWDVSANKSYNAGQTYPTLGNGDYLVPANSDYNGYYQQYVYHTSYTRGNVTYTNCWEGCVQSKYTGSGFTQKLPYSSLADKPVRFFSYAGCQFISCPTINNDGSSSTLSAKTNLRHVSFYNCTKMTYAPSLPSGLTSLDYTFGNTKISDPPTLSGLTNLLYADYCFYGCSSLTSQPIISGLSSLKSTVGMFSYCTGLVGTSDNPKWTLTLPSNVKDIGLMYQGCTGIMRATKIPSGVTSIYGMFRGCTNLEGNIRIDDPESIANTREVFKNTSKRIILLGPPSGFNRLSSISNIYSNVYAGIVANINSFTAIRGTYSNDTFTETVNGTWCKLTLSYTAPNVTNALIKPPSLKDSNDNTISTTWHIGSISGTILTSSGSQIQSSGTLVACIDLGSSSTSETFKVQTNVTYTYDSLTYNYDSGYKNATLTYSNALIDVNPLGNGIAFWGEVGDNYNGLKINKPVDINGNMSLSGDISNIMNWDGSSTPASQMTRSRRVKTSDESDYVGLFGTSVYPTASGQRKAGGVGAYIGARHPNANIDNYIVAYVNPDGTRGYGVSDPAKFREVIGVDNLWHVTTPTTTGYSFSANQYRSLSITLSTTYSNYTPIVIRAVCTSHSAIRVFNYSISNGTTLNFETLSQSSSSLSGVNFAFKVLWLNNNFF